MNPVIFIILAVITVGSALMVIISRNPVNSILFLLLAFFGLASFYVTLGAQFIAAVQLIVYAGAILVLFLFVVMLLNVGRIEERNPAFMKALGVVTGGVLFLLILNIVSGARITENPGLELVPTASLSEILFTKYLLPFELAGVLLTVALVGAVVLVKRKAN